MNNHPTFDATDCPGGDDVYKRNQFLQYFIGNKMPSGLFNTDYPNVLYLCQTNSPDNHIKSYYSTIFDKTTMNAILSAYIVTQEEAKKIGQAVRPTNNPWESYHGKLLNQGK